MDSANNVAKHVELETQPYVILRPGTWNNFVVTPELIEHVKSNCLLPIAIRDSFGKDAKFCGYVLDMTVENGDLVAHCKLHEPEKSQCESGSRPCAVITSHLDAISGAEKTEIRECFVSKVPVFP